MERQMTLRKIADQAEVNSVEQVRHYFVRNGIFPVGRSGSANVYSATDAQNYITYAQRHRRNVKTRPPM
ncbi:hypothetical protein [Ligilactobacillus equi]